MELSLFVAGCGEMDINESLCWARNMGVQAVEIPVDGRWPATDVEILLAQPERLTDALESTQLTIAALSNHWDSQLVLGPHTEDTAPLFAGTPQEQIEHGTRRTLMAVELAKALGVDLVCGFTGCPEFSRWFPWPDPKGWEAMETVFVDRWTPIIAEFEARGVRFGHECHPKQIAYNVDTAVRAVGLMGDSPSWGYNLDPANLMTLGVDPVVFAMELTDRVWHVHGKDYELVHHNATRSGWLAHGPWSRPDRGFRFRTAGWGQVSWRPLLTELHVRGFDGYVSVEHEDPTMGRDEGIAKGLEFLKPLMLRSQPEVTW